MTLKNSKNNKRRRKENKKSDPRREKDNTNNLRSLFKMVLAVEFSLTYQLDSIVKFPVIEKLIKRKYFFYLILLNRK